mmetsp:Transcript_28544/g.77253  ORF Transcript_28544/g.77253 Transcript_28544/m.77253 type:complete len:283 (-) Transcript_28544:462-1310(-)
MTSGLIDKITRTIIFVLVCVDITTVSAQEQYDSFDGRIGKGTASWFEAERWTGIGRVPTQTDSVSIDEANTYAAIDDKSLTAKVLELVIGRSASSNALGSVHLDLLKGTKLTVKKGMTIGELNGSDGTVYAEDGSKIIIGGVLTVGSKGNGLLVLSGSSQINAKNLLVRGNSRVIMGDGSKLQLKGNKKKSVNNLISKGMIVTETTGSRSFVVKKANGKTTITVKVEGDVDLDCENRTLRYKNKKKKNCNWVKKKKKQRCDLPWKNELLRDWCPQSCNSACN